MHMSVSPSYLYSLCQAHCVWEVARALLDAEANPHARTGHRFLLAATLKDDADPDALRLGLEVRVAVSHGYMPPALGPRGSKAYS